MEQQPAASEIGSLVAAVDAAVAALDEASPALASGRELLDALLASTRVEARLHAWRAALTGRIEAGETAWQVHGTSTATWLADAANLTRREAARIVRQGQELDRYATVGAAARSGAVLPEQAEAITGVLADLPDDLPSEVTQRAPQACHAHHLQPWWAGGVTSLANLVLACPHHHGIVEPGHDPAADRWLARIGADGTPEVIPPLRVDPAQRPRRHARFLHRGSDGAPPLVTAGQPSRAGSDP